MEDDTTMSQEDQRNCDGRGIGGLGRSSKKSKQKKVPQRGLGVAQLEKIRLEEQQKRDAATILPSPSTLSSTKPSYQPLPIKNFHDSNQSPSTTLLPCEPPSEFRSPLLLQQQQHMDATKVPSTVPLANSGGFEALWPVVPGQGNVPKWWSSYQFESEKNNFGVEPGFPILPSLPFESNPIWPLPNLMQRTPQYQHQSSSSVVNVSSGTSSTSMPHFSIEPPSNQSNNGSSVPVRPMEKMVGMKRPYPFSLDFPHGPAFNYNFPTFGEIRTNAKTSCGNGSGFNFDAGNSTSREVPSSSASNSEPNSKKRNEEDENFSGDFLTLAPPSRTSYPPSKSKSSSTFLAFPSEGNVEDQIPTPPVYRLFNQQKQPFYGFFLPEPKEEQIGQTASRIQNGHEVGESVDLNLKL
ncbi:WAS/WASL-interacting protein family member [Spatholobus suberectus]|nr:WAS/WASL-interacting protein family member [Spatholobus suberectus]